MWGEANKLYARADPFAVKAHTRSQSERRAVGQIKHNDNLGRDAQMLSGFQQRAARAQVQHVRDDRDAAMKENQILRCRLAAHAALLVIHFVMYLPHPARRTFLRDARRLEWRCE